MFRRAGPVCIIALHYFSWLGSVCLCVCIGGGVAQFDLTRHWLPGLACALLPVGVGLSSHCVW